MSPAQFQLYVPDHYSALSMDIGFLEKAKQLGRYVQLPIEAVNFRQGFQLTHSYG